MTEGGPARVQLTEVAPRDGFQSIAELVPTRTKIELIRELIASGFERVEIGSFVSPRAIPQMADTGDIAEYFKDRSDLRLSALVPNAKGAERALRREVGELVYVVSASEAHNLSNVHRSIERSLQELVEIVRMRDADRAFRMRVDVATAFDCPFEGTVPLDQVRSVVERIAEIAGTVEIALCDTTGRANPYGVEERFRALMAAAGTGIDWAYHGHDTFGMGVANALFAFRAGVRTFDASAAGLGGCPFAPGATGNTATEDLVFAFEGGGIDTGIDMASLLDVADRIAGLEGASLGGHLRRVPRDRAIPQHRAAGSVGVSG